METNVFSRAADCFFAIRGTPGSSLIGIAEGFATAASVHEATGFPVAVAFDCGNLLPVAGALRKRYPGARIILCADDDWQRVNQQTGEPENIGIIKAHEAAEAVGGIVAAPRFGADRSGRDTDWNDLARSAGPEAVRRQIEAILRDARKMGEDRVPL